MSNLRFLLVYTPTLINAAMVGRPLSSSSTTSRELLSRLVVDEDDLICFKITENCHVLVNQFHGNFRFKTLGCSEIKSVFRDVT